MSYRHSNNLVIDRSKCLFCGNCAERCVMDNIRLELAPCRNACPLGQNCQAYIQQIARGQGERALATILETNPFPGILGRICHNPCESACARSRVDGQPVAIRALKRMLADTRTRPAPQAPLSERPERIAVIGSGPAGLMAGWELRRKGYRVVIYEKGSKPGGNLTRVIPDFRLPVATAMAEVEWLKEWGVEFRTGVEIGKDVAFEAIRSENAAVVVATGGGQSMRLGIEGEDYSNVVHALPFLEAAKEGNPPALGNSVVVIGGGNAAVDAAQTARRLGASTVRLVCLERRNEMPAHPHCLEEALEEGVIMECGWGPRAFTGFDGARASALQCRLCLCVWQDGCFLPQLDCEIERTFEADSFIVAIGDRPDGAFLGSIGLMVGKGCRASADARTLETAVPGVFAAGDVVSGPSSVVQAMASGRAAAESADRYIRGEDLRFGRSYPGPVLTDFPIRTDKAAPIPRQSWRRLAPAGRIGMRETNAAIDESRAGEESLRCLSCGVPVAYHDTCWYCLPCEVSCPEQALRLEVPYLIR